jgi:hypothetical protein
MNENCLHWLGLSIISFCFQGNHDFFPVRICFGLDMLPYVVFAVGIILL